MLQYVQYVAGVQQNLFQERMAVLCMCVCVCVSCHKCLVTNVYQQSNMHFYLTHFFNSDFTLFLHLIPYHMWHQ